MRLVSSFCVPKQTARSAHFDWILAASTLSANCTELADLANVFRPMPVLLPHPFKHLCMTRLLGARSAFSLLTCAVQGLSIKFPEFVQKILVNVLLKVLQRVLQTVLTQGIRIAWTSSNRCGCTSKPKEMQQSAGSVCKALENGTSTATDQ